VIGEDWIGDERIGEELAATVDEEGVMSLYLGSGSLNSDTFAGDDIGDDVGRYFVGCSGTFS
jgi:hypothetical protein